MDSEGEELATPKFPSLVPGEGNERFYYSSDEDQRDLQIHRMLPDIRTGRSIIVRSAGRKKSGRSSGRRSSRLSVKTPDVNVDNPDERGDEPKTSDDVFTPEPENDQERKDNYDSSERKDNYDSSQDVLNEDRNEDGENEQMYPGSKVVFQMEPQNDDVQTNDDTYQSNPDTVDDNTANDDTHQSNPVTMDDSTTTDDVYISNPVTMGDTTVVEDDGYDTDLEDKYEFQHKEFEHRLLISRQNTDIGHLSYDEACQNYGATSLRRVSSQLWLTKMQLQHVGLNIKQVKAVCVGLLNNTKVEDLDLEGNGIECVGIGFIADLLRRNKFILRVSLKGNEIGEKGSVCLCDLLQVTTWLNQFNLDGCQIGDHEMIHLATGFQNNDSVKWLSLSHNKIGILGGVQLGRALGVNMSLEYLDVSWNQIRSSGAVSVCKSLQKNHSIQKMDISWNGLGFEGSLAMGEALKTNKTLRVLDMSNNRINWNCVPYIGRGLRTCKTLEILDLGHNPLSMEGCDELLESIAKPSCGLKHLGLESIPINSKVAFNATEISRNRKFTLHHGGILSTHDIIGIQRVKPKEPMSLLTRYLGTIGIRVVDLFRMFDTENRYYVSREKFIRGLKRVRAPLDDDEIREVMKKIGVSKGGQINYQLLAAGVRKHIREERMEDMRQEALERKRRDDRRRILQSDGIFSAPNNSYYFPSVYNIYPTGIIGRHGDSTTPTAYSGLSRQGSYGNVNTPGSFLPKISSSSDSPRSLMVRSDTDSLRQTPGSPLRPVVTIPKKKKKYRHKTHPDVVHVASKSRKVSQMTGYLPPLANLKIRDNA